MCFGSPQSVSRNTSRGYQASCTCVTDPSNCCNDVINFNSIIFLTTFFRHHHGHPFQLSLSSSSDIHPIPLPLPPPPFSLPLPPPPYHHHHHHYHHPLHDRHLYQHHHRNCKINSPPSLTPRLWRQADHRCHPPPTLGGSTGLVASTVHSTSSLVTYFFIFFYPGSKIWKKKEKPLTITLKPDGE